jgi:hypothetical protein
MTLMRSPGTRPDSALPLNDLQASNALDLGPEPRMPGKHALNPPIVTILGAGIAGMTAAHELVERGFLVQVVEAEEDPYSPGTPLVGGMAANQRARVRANVEDLHQDLIDIATAPDERVKPEDRQVAACLLELFAFNRRVWLSTEKPARVRRVIYAAAPDADKKSLKFAKSLVGDLKDARERHRVQWIWDLALRSVLVGDIVAADNSSREELRTTARQVFCDLKRLSNTEELAIRLFSFAQFQSVEREHIKEALHTMVIPALEREFLSFRLRPRVLCGFEAEAPRARELFKIWAAWLRKRVPHCSLSLPDEIDQVAVEIVNPPPGAVSGAPRVHCWLEVDIIEQRLPGEHGFRFFPSFYRHIDDTMQRIPLFQGNQPTGKTVLNNLNPTIFQGIGFSESDTKKLAYPKGAPPGGHPRTQNGITRDGGDVGWDNSDREFCPPPPVEGTVVTLDRDLPRSIQGLRDRTDRLVRRLGGTPRDAVLLFAKLFRFMSTSPERRRLEYENVTWAKFLDVEKFSPPMQSQIKSAAQALVAFAVTVADARTYGNTAIQLLFDQLNGSNQTDRTLNGPTSDAWLEPWRGYLERQGVRFFCRKVEALDVIDEELVPVFSREKGVNGLATDGSRLLTDKEEHPGLRPDFYVLALNFERTRELLSKLPAIDAEKAPDFKQILKFWEEVQEKKGLEFMTGIQFFFDAKTDVGRGHMYFPKSAWALSSIAQTEFWSQQGSFADGYFGVLSVGICNPGKNPVHPDKKDFWHWLQKGNRHVEALQDRWANRYVVAKRVFDELKVRIGTAGQLDEPRCYHIDQKLSPMWEGENEDGPEISAEEKEHVGEPYPEFARFLASLAGVEKFRPGRDLDDHCVGDEEIAYHVNYNRWVVCSTFMATHTRLTTMEAANESGRHAVTAILKKLGESVPDENDESNWQPIEAYHHQGRMRRLNRKMYNGSRRLYDLPAFFNPEDYELEDFGVLRRIDRRLSALGLEHLLDILKFDQKLNHAMDAVDIYGDETTLRELLGVLFSGIDAALTDEFGRDYRTNFDGLRPTAENMTKANLLPKVFPELRNLLETLAKA